MEAASLPFSLVNCPGSGLGLWGAVIEWESKPLSEAQFTVRVSTAQAGGPSIKATGHP